MNSTYELIQRGMKCHQEGELEAAASLYEAVLREEPKLVDVRTRLGSIRLRQGRVDEAIAEFELALVADPHSEEALNSLGNALAAGKRFEEALACYDAVLTIRPTHWAALNNRGNVLYALGRYDEAVSAYGATIAVAPAEAAPYFNRGLTHFAMLDYAQSVADFDVAIGLCPDHAEALHARGNALRALRRYEESSASYAEAVSRNPVLSYAIGNAINARMQLCDWAQYDEALEHLIRGVHEERPVAVPFIFFSLCDDPVAQLRCATQYAKTNHSIEALPLNKTSDTQRDKIRVAYLSAKFHDHAGARLIAELLELHDKRRFQTIGISFGPEVRGGMRARLQGTFDEFFDVRMANDVDIASLVRERNVDIAIDLMGYQENARPNIFAYRAAPIQVSFLSWTGTMGAPFIDYIVGDKVVIPAGHEDYYSECVVRLPDSYQVNDTKKVIAARTPTRAEVGLPDNGFVFCCFNNNFKITPSVFEVWMRLLKRVDHSVLWLLRATTTAESNLRNEAKSCGIDPDRLVFAPRAPLGDHLARHRLADLFLDTVPCNAHVTASDALWTGLPVLTCMGQSFMSRVAGSLLTALALPELITFTLSEYESRALELAISVSFLKDIKEKVARNRAFAPLFDTSRYRRHIESAYTTMWQLHQRGDRPRSFDVQALNN